MTRAQKRRRGATFTLFVLVFTVVLLMGAGTFVDASKQTFASAAFQAQMTRLREGAFAGVAWASAAADEGVAEGKASFHSLALKTASFR